MLVKLIDKNNKGRVVQEASEKIATASYHKPYKVLQGPKKGQYLINYGGGTMSPKVTKYFDPKDYDNDKAAFDAADTELTDYKNREDKNEKRIFEVSREVEQLISNLERKKNDQKDKVSS